MSRKGYGNGEVYCLSVYPFHHTLHYKCEQEPSVKNLFSFHVYLRQDGNIELQKESVRPDELQKNGRRSARL